MKTIASTASLLFRSTGIVVSSSSSIERPRDHAVHAKAPLRCLVAFIAVLVTLPAHAANMDSLLDSMFYRTSTDPGAYESQRRTGYVAGSTL